jgi:hypothetical protein
LQLLHLGLSGIATVLGLREGLPHLLQRAAIGRDRLPQLLELVPARVYVLAQRSPVLLVRADGPLDLAQPLLGLR